MNYEFELVDDYQRFECPKNCETCPVVFLCENYRRLIQEGLDREVEYLKKEAAENEAVFDTIRSDGKTYVHVHTTEARKSPNPNAYCRLYRVFRNTNSGERVYVFEDVFYPEGIPTTKPEV